MATSIYQINKGVNRSIELKGLKAQYIGYLAIGLVALLISFSILYIIGLNPFICLLLIGTAGVVLVMHVYRMSNKYGEFGMLKKLAQRNIPQVIHCRSRAVFILSDKSVKSKYK